MNPVHEVRGGLRIAWLASAVCAGSATAILCSAHQVGSVTEQVALLLWVPGYLVFWSTSLVVTFLGTRRATRRFMRTKPAYRKAFHDGQQDGFLLGKQAGAMEEHNAAKELAAARLRTRTERLTAKR